MAAVLSGGVSDYAEFDRLFAERIGRTAPGGCYAVFDRSGVVHSAGFGRSDLAGTVPGLDTAFRIASCTKSFTAAALLIARDAGALALDDPVREYVPEFSAVAVGGESVEVTIRMLATMSGGLATDDPWADRQESMATTELRALLSAGIRHVSVPGTEFEYSNLGFAVLGLVLEAATGREYREFVTDELLRPLALDATGFDSSVAAPGGVARGYRRGQAHDAEAEWVELGFSEPGAFSPIGGLFSTARDLASWARWLNASVVTGEAHASAQAGDSVLRAASRREMQQLQRIVPSIDTVAPTRLGYGLGLFVESDPARGTTVMHSGGYPGFSSHMRWEPATGHGIVAFENATYAGVNNVAAHAMDLIAGSAASTPRAELWPETRLAADAIDRVLRSGGDLSRLAELCSENVAMDVPWNERTAQAAAVLAEAGRLADAGERGASLSPAHAEWFLLGERATVRCSIRMTPTEPPLVQSLAVEVCSAEQAD